MEFILSLCRAIVQLAHPAVAAGLLPLHASHLPAAAHPHHGDQGGPARGRPRTDLPARATQLGLRT